MRESDERVTVDSLIKILTDRFSMFRFTFIFPCLHLQKEIEEPYPTILELLV